MEREPDYLGQQIHDEAKSCRGSNLKGAYPGNVIFLSLPYVFLFFFFNLKVSNLLSIWFNWVWAKLIKIVNRLHSTAEKENKRNC